MFVPSVVLTPLHTMDMSPRVTQHLRRSCAESNLKAPHTNKTRSPSLWNSATVLQRPSIGTVPRCLCPLLLTPLHTMDMSPRVTQHLRRSCAESNPRAPHTNKTRSPPFGIPQLLSCHEENVWPRTLAKGLVRHRPAMFVPSVVLTPLHTMDMSHRVTQHLRRSCAESIPRAPHSNKTRSPPFGIPQLLSCHEENVWPRTLAKGLV